MCFGGGCQGSRNPLKMKLTCTTCMRLSANKTLKCQSNSRTASPVGWVWVGHLSNAKFCIECYIQYESGLFCMGAFLHFHYNWNGCVHAMHQQWRLHSGLLTFILPLLHPSTAMEIGLWSPQKKRHGLINPGQQQAATE